MPRVRLKSIEDSLRILWGDAVADDFADPSWVIGKRAAFPGHYARYMPASRRMLETLLRTVLGSMSHTTAARVNALALVRGYGMPLLWKCGHCEISSDLAGFFDIDHRIPQSEGGSDEPTNLEIVCPNCHRLKTIRDRVRVKEERLRAQSLADLNEVGFVSDE